MNEDRDSVVASSHEAGMHVTLKSYVVGFILAVTLTCTSFALVHIHVAHHHEFPPDSFMGIALPFLALVQFFVQLFFFLHIGKETKPRWKLLVLGFMILIVLILVIGSLWIMHNLNYRMTPQQINTYMLHQDGGI
jgi:cytochrome o ubiquinol oxidase subunit IV